MKVVIYFETRVGVKFHVMLKTIKQKTSNTDRRSINQDRIEIYLFLLPPAVLYPIPAFHVQATRGFWVFFKETEKCAGFGGTEKFSPKLSANLFLLLPFVDFLLSGYQFLLV